MLKAGYNVSNHQLEWMQINSTLIFPFNLEKERLKIHQDHKIPLIQTKSTLLITVNCI